MATSKKAASGFTMSDLQGYHLAPVSDQKRSRIVLTVLWAALCLPSASFSQVPAGDLSGDAVKNSNPPLAISPVTPDQSASTWRYPHTPILMRLGVSAGMQAGGPIRYNTRFPEVKPDPHPTSYFHAPSFASIEVEFPLTNGALLIGLVSRQDYAHSGIKTRQVNHEGENWTVDRFEFSDTGLVLGWIFGERFREAWWWADLSILGDRGGVDAKMTRASVQASSTAQVNITALSFRARASAGLINAGPFQLSAGPELHLPIWYRLSDQSDLELRPWIADTLALKASGSIGLAIMTSLRF